MAYRITVLPRQLYIDVPAGKTLLEALRDAALAPDAPCGGAGRCGKCTVWVDGAPVSACRTPVDRDMTVTLPAAGETRILTGGTAIGSGTSPVQEGYLLALDIGTTTVAGFLLDPHSGAELAAASCLNPQGSFGADVISRIQYALKGQMEPLTGSIRRCVESMILDLCREASIHPRQIGVIAPVGNPAMRQFFFGIQPDNLARIPFAPVLNRAEIVSAAPYLPLCENAALLMVPDISGFVGADAAAGVLAAGLDCEEQNTLLVDIGTNGEMVLGSSRRMTACSAAAGPALEGAGIRFGMRGQTGAIDHVWPENGQLRCSVIGGGEARGICGSGLIDAAAAALDAGLLNGRGKILTEDGLLHLTEGIYLTLDDIRQLQLAKGAIAAGITLMTAHLGITLADIDRVYLAGAFGTYLDPRSACRIGLLPPELEGKITAIGNAAGSGAKILACRAGALDHARRIAVNTEFIELAAQPGFARCFAKSMRF